MTPPFSRRMSRVSPSAIMELLKTTAAGDYISFASGLPDPDLYPFDALRAIADEVLATDGRAGLQYGPAEGHPPLRAWVAERLRARGLPATPEHVLITHGSQQALDLAARLFLDPGDRVVLESPSYLAAIQAFESYEAVYDAVPLDDNGVDAQAVVARLADRSPRLLFLLPNFQNPTGITLALERRERIAAAAARTGTPLLEDDAYYDLRYDGEPLPPLAALAPNPWAIYTGTFSKTIAPGLRVGWLYAQAPVVERLAQLKQITDLHTGSLTQRMALRFCEQGRLEPQIERLRGVYRERRDAMMDGLATELWGLARWTHPAGGMFLLLELSEDRDAAALLEAALARGIVFVPGTAFYPSGGGRHALRLNFVSEPPDRIRRGLGILGKLLREAT
jgi:2-aminoadipate transaminase